MYINSQTHFSFKYDTLSPEELIMECIENGIHKIALTDIQSTAAYIEIFRFLKNEYAHYPLKIIPGIEFRNQKQLIYIGIARTNLGFEELNAFLSYYNRNDLPLQSRPRFTDNVAVIYLMHTAPENLRTNEFIGVKPEELNRLRYQHHKFNKEKLLALETVTFKNKTGFNMHRLLRAIQQNQLLSRLDKSLQAQTSEFMKTKEVLTQHY
ncbi:PHP domain-containing protein [Marivirga sp.]|uniref:PHP domain-containing protein n=1 Tax=Marivirga sp. TaxID=2018662 RepID=UPI002D7F150B|nr:PHP domain-containing protein [Marivirga sp.]HET8858843.1 PHP domain-containing protein [Marivirga sp.]